LGLLTKDDIILKFSSIWSDFIYYSGNSLITYFSILLLDIFLLLISYPESLCFFKDYNFLIESLLNYVKFNFISGDFVGVSI